MLSIIWNRLLFKMLKLWNDFERFWHSSISLQCNNCHKALKGLCTSAPLCSYMGISHRWRSQMCWHNWPGMVFNALKYIFCISTCTLFIIIIIELLFKVKLYHIIFRNNPKFWRIESLLFTFVSHALQLFNK